MFKNHLVLIGMPASGKTTLALALSSLTSLPFLDGDQEIERRTGERLETIISRLGIDGFLKLEEETLLSLDLKSCVFSPGGSAVYSKNAMAHVTDGAFTLCLDAPLTVLEKRMGDPVARGVIMRPGQTLEDLYLERESLYHAYADLILSTGDHTVPELVHELLPRLRDLGLA
ncbi:MAG: shikimate kinase [Clostridia bacterium]|nr:shikimate kinase [Clostridia bacterium]